MTSPLSPLRTWEISEKHMVGEPQQMVVGKQASSVSACDLEREPMIVAIIHDNIPRDTKRAPS